MEQSPLEQSLRLLRKNPEPWTVLFYAALMGMIVCVASINFVPAMQKQAMRKFHYKLSPFYEWAAWQLIPSMYSFHNEILLSPSMLVSDFSLPLDKDVLRLSVNHYPMRIVTYSLSRSQLFVRMPFYVYLRSSFRDQSIVSSYSVTLSGYAMQVILLNAYERSK